MKVNETVKFAKMHVDIALKVSHCPNEYMPGGGWLLYKVF